MRQILAILSAAAIAAACTAAAPLETSPPVAATLPTVAIGAPLPGATLPLGVEAQVLLSASDATGVSRIDLLVDGVVVDTFTTANPAGEPQVAAQLGWTPNTPGAHALTATAYRPDGTASAPAVVAVAVASIAAGSAPPTAAASLPPSVTAEPSSPSPAPTPSRPPPTARPPTARPSNLVSQAPTAQATELALPELQFSVVQDIRTEVVANEYGVRTDVTVGIHNGGLAEAGPFILRVNCRGFPMEKQLDGISVGVNGYVTLSFIWGLPVDPNLSTLAAIDFYDQVPEYDEDNNIQGFGNSDCTV